MHSMVSADLDEFPRLQMHGFGKTVPSPWYKRLGFQRKAQDIVIWTQVGNAKMQADLMWWGRWLG